MLKYKVLSEKKILLIFTGFIFLYFLPFLVLGENAHLLIHDNLDGIIPTIKILLETNSFSKGIDATVTRLMDQNIPISSAYSFYDLSIIWFKIFGMFWGYVLNKLVMSLIAFYGTYLLLKELLQDYNLSTIILASCSLLYSFLPFWSFNLSVAGVPMILYCFLHIKNKKHNWLIWIYLIIFPFYSSLILSGVFILFIVFTLHLYDYFKTKKIEKINIISFLLVVICYSISHISLIKNHLFSSYLSHRTEIKIITSDFITALSNTYDVFTIGHEFALGFQFCFFPLIFLAILVQFENREFNKLFFIIVSVLATTTIFYGFTQLNIAEPIMFKLSKLISIQINRFILINPILWLILFGISISIVSNFFNNIGKKLCYLSLIVSITYFIYNHEMIRNRNMCSYKQFFAEKQFKKIKKFIPNNIQKYSVINVGIHPSIAQFNGFHTLDGYLSDYPLYYKKKFRKIILKELNKNIEIKKYFDNWGSRCYSFSSELGLSFMNYKGNNITLNSLELNYELLKKMGCDYLFASIKINTISNDKIKFLQEFEDEESCWDIYVYKIV